MSHLSSTTSYILQGDGKQENMLMLHQVHLLDDNLELQFLANALNGVVKKYNVLKLLQLALSHG